MDAAVARAEFDEVWAVLQAMQEQDDVLDDIIHEMQAERRLTKGFNDSRLRERVEVLGPTLTLDKLRRAIATRCLDRLARPWDEMVQWLVLLSDIFQKLLSQLGVLSQLDWWIASSTSPIPCLDGRQCRLRLPTQRQKFPLTSRRSPEHTRNLPRSVPWQNSFSVGLSVWLRCCWLAERLRSHKRQQAIWRVDKGRI